MTFFSTNSRFHEFSKIPKQSGKKIESKIKIANPFTLPSISHKMRLYVRIFKYYYHFVTFFYEIMISRISFFQNNMLSVLIGYHKNTKAFIYMKKIRDS